jgi:chaperonin GroES
MSNFKPLHDRVLVKRLPSEEKTAGGIIIPDSVQEKPQQGEIIAAGSGSRRADGNIDPLGVKVGDKILFGKYAGTEVKMQGVDYIIMKETDILGVLE